MNRKHHLTIVAGLLGLSCLVQVVAIGRATTTGLDTVRFVSMAQSIEHQGLLRAVRTHGQQPLFPALIWTVHKVLRGTIGEFPAAWAFSAQVAAAIALVLTLIPLYLLLLRLVSPSAAAGASLLFCLLPELSRLGADALADSTHLLLFTVALWTIVEYLGRRNLCRVAGVDGHRREALVGERPASAAGEDTRHRRSSAPLWLLPAGGAIALATLARAEVLVLAAALALALGVFQWLPRRRASWAALTAAAACFLLGLSLVWAPYLSVVGTPTPPTALKRLLGRHDVERPSPEQAAAASTDAWRLPDGEPVSFDAKEPTISLRQRGYPAALVRFGRNLAEATGYWVGLLAVFGAWRLRHDATSDADWLVRGFFVLFSLLAIRFAAREGYLEPRHLLTLVVAAIGSAGHGALELGSLLACRLGRIPLLPARRRTVPSGGPLRSIPATHSTKPHRPRPRIVSLAGFAIVLLAAAGCLPKAIAPLHHSRLGHRAAGEWLARRTDPADAVLDTLGWAGLYSGRRTYAYREAAVALCDPHLAYLVLEDREMGYSSGRSRTIRWLIRTAGQVVAEFPAAATRRSFQQPVVVYRWYPDRFRDQLKSDAASAALSGAATGLPGTQSLAASWASTVSATNPQSPIPNP